MRSGLFNLPDGLPVLRHPANELCDHRAATRVSSTPDFLKETRGVMTTFVPTLLKVNSEV